jgi:hypothetical protein
MGRGLSAFRRCVLGLVALVLTQGWIAARGQEAGTPATSEPEQIWMVLPKPKPASGPQTPPSRPAFSGRVVTRFTFEDPSDGEDVPRNWFRAQHNPPQRERLGFPAFNRATLDFSRGANGSMASIQLPTRGGSTSLRLAPGRVVVFSDATYRVSAMVRTSGLKHARAVIETTLLDEARQPLPGTRQRSAPVIAETDWMPISLTIAGGNPAASFLQLELQLLQPEQLHGMDTLMRSDADSAESDDGAEAPTDTTATPRPRDAAGSVTPVMSLPGGTAPYRAWRQEQDLSGSAWFDDVIVLQLPRVSLNTGRAGNVYFTPDVPDLQVVVRDLTGDELTTELIVRDLDNTVVSTQRLKIPRGGSSAQTRLNLPAFGWYRVEMNLVGVANVPTQASRLSETTILWMPGSPTADGSGLVSPLRPFALYADRMTTDALPTLPGLTARLGIPRLTAAMPTQHAPGSPDPATALDKTLNSMVNSPLDFTLALTKIPLEVADKLRLDPERPIMLGSVEPSHWLPAIAALTGDASQRVMSWQIGPSLLPTPLDHDVTSRYLQTIRTNLSRISANPRLMLPWTADSQWLEAGGLGETSSAGGPEGAGGGSGRASARPFAGASITVPAGYPASSLRGMLDNFARLPGDGLDVTYIIETLPLDVHSRRDQLEHALQMAIQLWAETHALKREHPPVRVGLTDPWTIGDDKRLRPEAVLGGFSTLANVTESMRVIGEVPSEPGIRGLILAPESGNAIGSLGIGGGMLIAWNERSSATNPTITGFFGGGTLTIKDPFGNETQLPPDRASGRHIIPVSNMPSFVSGIDSHLVQFLADLKVNPSFIPAVVANHDCELVLRNPWPTRITGDITLLNPDLRNSRRDQNWTLSPTTPMPFSIGPGQTVRLPFTFQFTSAEEAGVKQVPMVVRLSADRAYPAMRLSKPINIGLEDLELAVSAQLGPREDGPDVIVTAVSSNTGKLTRTLQLTTSAPGFASQSQPIVDLGPGESAVRRFVFRNAAEGLSGRRVRVLLVDVDGAERMTKVTIVP